MIDLHCHALPGIDDGPEAIEGSVALVRAAAAAGTRTIVATPHVNRRYPNDAATIAGLVGELNGRLADAEIAVQVRPGAEIALTHIAKLDAAQLPRMGLGGGPWLLVEPPFTPVASNLDALLLDIQRQGHRVLLAHPERCAALRKHPQMLRSLVRAGMRTSVTATSLVGLFGDGARRFALAMAEEGLLHNVASDAHDHSTRPPGMAAELGRAGLGALTEWLTQTVPAAILDGAETIPRRPSTVPLRTKRRWLERRR
ncbi:MAG TPA: CpsB/CapC family capsule biosynthesis tyrosine phosphatase [Solirubrobacteraceae bacterium]|nr:CpsB/CapC family capsule biosynthesis tyrosine phosphatase [Solirubrobacteraceae bacterium]